MKASAIALFFGACLASVASASHLGYGAPLAAPLAVQAVSTGTSSQFRQEDNLGNYNFGYDEAHATGSTSRREEQINGVRRGAYSLSDADGRVRIVTYIADDNGFRATIQSNEPGVEPKDPADVLINKAAPVVAAPAPLPAPIAAPLPAPIAAPLPAPLAAPLPAPLPAPIAVKGGFIRHAQLAAPLPAPLPAPVQVAAPIQQVAEVYDETPRAFSYSFGTHHPALASYAPAAPLAPLPAPLAAPLPAPVQLALPAPVKGFLAHPAPIVQQQKLDY